MRERTQIFGGGVNLAELAEGESVRFRWSRIGAFVGLVAAFVLVSGITRAVDRVASPTLESIRERGFVRCGVRDKLVGFSVVDRNGTWSGFNVDFCAALAAAVLGSEKAVKYLPLVNGLQYGALVAGEVDVVVGADAWTLSRDTELGVRFAGTLFFDGQVFLVRRDQFAASALELSGAKICALDGTRASQGLNWFFESRQMRYTLESQARWEDAVALYAKGECSVLTGDMSLLAAQRLIMAEPEAHQILREVISKEPLGPMIKAGDDVWFTIVRWTLNALLEAEELGITQNNVGGLSDTKEPRIRQFLGLGTNLGDSMGLSRDWALNAISKVGNYGEIYARHLGKDSPLQLPRGLNALWTNRGLMYSAPLR